MNNFRTHKAGDILQSLEENGILVVSTVNTTDCLQSLNLNQQSCQRLSTGQVQTVPCKGGLKKSAGARE